MSERADKFLARVIDHCAGLTDQQQLQFLTAQINAWNRAYARFVCRNEGDTDPPEKPGDPASASDYLLTICGLSVLRSRVVTRLGLAKVAA